jgi:hypothetical protein
VRPRFLLALLAALTLGVALASPASASHSWNGYHWARTSNPFTLKLGDNVGATWDSYLQTTSSDWSKSTVLDTTIVSGQTRPRTCKAASGRVEVCNAAYGQTGWLGVASISVTGGVHITQGTVKLNDTYFAMAQYNMPAERNLVTCQEVGHTLGLDHQDENFSNPNLGTCMDYTNDPSTNQHPNQHDYDELGTIYSHLDSFNTVGSAAAGAAATAGNSPASWGRLVGRSATGRTATYVRDHGCGSKTITHVIWAR